MGLAAAGTACTAYAHERSFGETSAKYDTRPNVLFILTDQQRYDSLACNGNQDAITSNLDRLAKEGVRFNAGMRSPGNDPLAIWRRAEQLGMVASVMGTVENFASPDFENIIQNLPGLNVIIEHLAGVGAYFGPGREDKTVPYETYRTALELAKYPNTYLKVPGLGEFCPRPVPFRQPYPFEDVPPLIEMAIDAFGAERLMWGSDFPPVAAREGYRNSLKFPLEQLQSRSPEERELIFGGSAASLWRFGV